MSCATGTSSNQCTRGGRNDSNPEEGGNRRVAFGDGGNRQYIEQPTALSRLLGMAEDSRLARMSTTLTFHKWDTEDPATKEPRFGVRYWDEYFGQWVEVQPADGKPLFDTAAARDAFLEKLEWTVHRRVVSENRLN
jgi:hypothetical protein